MRNRRDKRDEITDAGESDLTIGARADHAAGATAVAVSMKRALRHMGPKRTAQTLRDLNQADGFDCMSCAWPDPAPSTGTVPSSARTVPRRWPRRPPRLG